MNFLRLTASLLLATVVMGSVASCASSVDTDLPLPPTGTLAQVVPPTSLDSLEESFSDAFAGLYEAQEADLTLEVRDGKLTLVKYLGSEKRVLIPQTLGGVKLEAIAADAFAASEVTTLSLPETLSKIEKGALADCKTLEALSTPLSSEEGSGHLGYLFGASGYMDNSRDVPATLKCLRLTGGATELADYALFDCNDLVCVSLPESIKTLGAYSLYRCISLQLLKTADLETVEEGALGSCTALEELVFSESLSSMGFGALEGCSGLRRLTLPFVGGTPNQNTYLAYVFGAEVPDFAKGFYPSRLQEIILLPSCEALGDYAFFELETLRKVTLPDGIATVGVRAFAGCVALNEISFGAGLEQIRENAFVGCERLERITLGTALSKLGVNAFYGCLSLKEIALPDTLEELPASCFADCVSLEGIELGGVEKVGKNAFRNCAALARVSGKDSVKFESGNDAAKRIAAN